MAINIYDRCSNPITGESFKAVSLTPYALTMQWIVRSGDYISVEHLHSHQDEVFHVKKGRLRMLIEGKEHIAGPGEKIVVTKGKRHVAYNDRDEEMEALVEYRPPLDQERLLQCFSGLINDGFVDEKGSPKIPMIGYMLKRMKCKAMIRPVGVSTPAFKLALNAFYLIGTLRGWNRLYEKYTK